MRNDLQDLRVILERNGIKYYETDGEIPGTDADTVMLQLPHGIWFRFTSDSSQYVTWKLCAYGVTESSGEAKAE